MKGIRDFFLKFPVICSLLFSLCLSILLIIVGICSQDFHSSSMEQLVLVFVCNPFLVYPFVLTLLNFLFFLFCKKESVLCAGHHIEYVTLIWGLTLFFLFLPFTQIQFADWEVTLYNSERHTPVATWSLPTLITLAAIALVGYLIIAIVPLQKRPPLITVFSISAMYLGCILCILWIVQIFQWNPTSFYLCLLPFNCILISVKRILEMIFQWKPEESPNSNSYEGNPFLSVFFRLLNHSRNWPWLAVLGIFPLLGISIAILTLFGQQPDTLIKAWTQTSDWNLSTQISPQNISIDEHYLCTVAAGGHPKIVKPLRMGVRHGHRVIVNRQLCIANAFEQILEERTPHFHRILRNFYDKHGYPIAKHIHSPYVADGIYFLMKPLEWFFLVILYCCDCKPENRIALQYFPKIPKDSLAK